MGEDLSLIVSGLEEIVGAIQTIGAMISGLFSKATNLIGFGDAIDKVVDRETQFLSVVLPSDVLSIVGISFTVVLAVAVKRSLTS